MENDASKNPPSLAVVVSESMSELRGRLIRSTDAEERQQLIKKIEARFAYYSFRAESTSDAILFFHNALIHAIQKDEHFGALQVGTDPLYQEPVVEFRSTLRLETLRSIVRQQQDAHVILQTLRPVPLAQNDCKRDYDIR